MKNCIFCKHFDIDLGSPGYSEYTPGSCGIAGCDKRHWNMTGDGNCREEFRLNLLKAETCPDFKEDRKP